MKRFQVWMYATLCALTQGCACIGVAEARTPVSIQVTVQLAVPNGTSIPLDVLVVLQATGTIVDAVTDVQGRAAITAEVSSDAQWVQVAISQGFQEIADDSKVTRYRRRVEELENHFAVPAPVIFKTVAGQTEYAVTLHLAQCVLIKGEVKNAVGVALGTRVEREGRPNSYFDWIPTGVFTSKGVPRVSSTLFYVTARNAAGDKMIRKIYDISESQAQDGVIDLGTLTLTPAAFDCRLGITVTGWSQRPASVAPQSSLITLVSTTGDREVIVPFHQQTGVAGSKSLIIDGRFPAQSGTWYILPGSSVAEPKLAKAVRLLRAGRSADLDTAGIPKIVLAADDQSNRNFAFWDVFQLVGSLPTP